MQIENSTEMNKDLLDILTQSIQRAAEVKFLKDSTNDHDLRRVNYTYFGYEKPNRF